ncbi:MAG TPA: hypothetical protein VM491_00930, partial [Burkholderiaceae bacterium]|nr:hypothetical protein [Burkholderiaceae bacterium]
MSWLRRLLGVEAPPARPPLRGRRWVVIAVRTGGTAAEPGLTLLAVAVNDATVVVSDSIELTLPAAAATAPGQPAPLGQKEGSVS